MGKGLDHYIGIVEQSHVKTASAKSPELNNALLSKIANELVGTERGVVTGAPAQVEAAKDGSEAALALAGQDAAAVAAADAAKALPVANQPVVSDATGGKVIDPKSMNKDPLAVAEAAGDTAKVAELKRAQEIGEVMATSFNETLEKQAMDRDYREAVEYLQSRGVLEGYDIVA